eukprot:CAMPEP_0172540894 /NCGR_PEP_ID=MMETSP1067-20121228/11799_1 /TAXON_ID=265564 ORGANISM="Thalassiosira punctigera, Strain Tpunct2005C2" /NCGR_SAMPLE_ID=MMETSP1067 /ASSEMBLY_ACC=CAM_ASM_000444 /LENGTH=45 /DNA_ID= /DNA_START= /DNA_END= /DNA_ORIENTATION=
MTRIACRPSSCSRTSSNAIIDKYAGHHLHDIRRLVPAFPTSSIPE